MYELVRACGSTYYIECPTKMGIYIDGERDAYLIDSGSSKDTGRKVRQILEKNSWSLKAIICTHSHADHVGGNAYLQQQTGCKIYAPGVESAITRYPVLEPALLFGGRPHRDLNSKFLMAQESFCEELRDAGENLPKNFEFFSLPGHYLDMTGVRTPDDVAFVADCVCSEATLAKYKIGFLYDIQAQLDTLERLKDMRAELFVSAHAQVTRDLSALAQINIDNIYETRRLLLSVLSSPKCFEHVLREVFDLNSLTMTVEQHALVGSTVRSFLSWLDDTGEVCIEISDNMLLWKTA